jgi:hypothetical protein
MNSKIAEKKLITLQLLVSMWSFHEDKLGQTDLNLHGRSYHLLSVQTHAQKIELALLTR